MWLVLMADAVAVTLAEAEFEVRPPVAAALRNLCEVTICLMISALRTMMVM